MKTPDPGIQASPAVSVVLPVLEEERDIGLLLSEVLNQVEPPGGFEVLVVDGGSRDRTRDIVDAVRATDPRLLLLDNRKRRSSAGRNVGARAARGEFVLFLDGHCRLPRSDYLVRVVQIFHATGAACLCRPQPLLDLAEGPWAHAIAAARHSWLGHNPGSDIYRGKATFTDPRSAGAAYLRRIVCELGGYDERFDACEDVEFNHRVARAGLPAYVHPDLRVDYRPRDNLRGLYLQMFRYGRGRARLMARHPGVVPWPLIAITLVLSLSCGVGLIAGMGQAGLVSGCAGLLGGMLVLTESLRLGGLSERTARLLLVFPVLYVGLVLGFWRGLLEFRKFRRAAHATGLSPSDLRSPS